ncbi:DUF1382 family protein [Vibrio phage vB_VneS_J26]
MSGVNKAAPQDMRKALEMVDHFRRAGIYFIPIPVCDDAVELVAKLQENLIKLEKKASDHE